MAERSGMWGGTPNRPEYPANLGRRGAERPAANRWGPDRLVEPDRADAIDGRHALDRDAALTPIFTALRRGRWRRPRGQAGGPGLRLAPEPVERRHDGPPTAPIPVVPALHALDPYPTGGYGAATVDPSASGGFRGVDPAASGGFRGVEPYASSGFRWPVVEPSASGGHRAAPVDLHTGGQRVVDPRAQGASGELHRMRSRGASVDPFDPGSFVPRADPAAPPPSRTETTAMWSPGDYSMAHQQVTDTGRHHRRLAPAGW
ncbi:MAG TPA: hypothetical protein VFY38_05415 [Pseudonocardia sp.]|nr:hypothetical protein [Pseudonocardia sp.]